MSQNTTVPETLRRVECIIPILNVGDLAASIRFYVDLLGFKLDWQEPQMASISRDGHAIMLAPRQQGNAGTWIWIGCDDIDGLYAHSLANGVTIREAPANYSWAYEMKIEDPDGHVLRFGSEPKSDRPVVGR